MDNTCNHFERSNGRLPASASVDDIVFHKEKDNGSYQVNHQPLSGNIDV